MIPIIRCLYGIPSQDLMLEMTEWLSEDEQRMLIILEDTSKKSLPSLLKDPRVRLISIEEHLEETLAEVALEFVFSSFEYFPKTGSAEKSFLRMQEIFTKLMQIQTDIHLRSSDYQDRGLTILKNICKNAPYLCKSRIGKKLFGAFDQIPAIICGAGPSLEKSAKYFSNLEEKVLIFAGGSALSALHFCNIAPHFAASIDPDPPLKRFFNHCSFEVPFFYQSRVCFKLLQVTQGPLLWMAPNGGYPIEMWLQNQLNMPEEIFDGGWNVMTFLTSIAYEMGCNPIVFVGCDLSYQGKNSYAPGVTDELTADVIEVEDEKGDLVYSKRDWVAARQWLEDFIERRLDRQWINASQKGLKIASAPRKNLQEVIKKFTLQRDLKGQIHAAIESIKLEKADSVKPLNALEASFKQSTHRCDRLLEILNRCYPNVPQKKYDYLMEKIGLEEEVCYRYFLLPVWNVWKNVFLREVSEDLSKTIAEDLHKWLFMKRICEDAVAL